MQLINQSLPQAKSNIRVAKLILQESGTYNPMFSRPYQTHVNPETLGNITRRIEETRGGAITGSLFSGVASNMIAPSATIGSEINIPMGWADRRIRFVLEVHVTNYHSGPMIYYFQGYTSHLGVSPQGNVDPQMEFILNSFIRVNRTTRATPYGNVVNDVVTESAHVINGNIVSQKTNDGVYTMRPQDIFTGIQSGYIENAYNHVSNNSIFDTRIQLNGQSVRSNRSNNLAGNFIAKVVDSYQTGKSLLDFGQGSEDIMGRCQNITAEASMFENAFIRAISNIRNINCATTFSYANLTQLDPNIDNVTQYLPMGRTAAMQVHQAGQTSYWNGSDRTTLVATILSNAIPAIMMELLLVKLSFRSTNYDITGTVNTTFTGAMSLANVDLTPHYELFKRRLEKEVLHDVTYGNQVMFMLDMNVDLFGETYITLQLDNEPAITYATPSFCDSLLSPVVTVDKANFFNVVHDFEVIMNSIPEERSVAYNPIV